MMSSILPIHLTTAIVGDALVTLVGVLCMLYIWENRKLKGKHFTGSLFKLPSLQSLDKITLRFLTVGFICNTIGMVTGAIMAADAWGEYWYTDPRQVLSFLTWLIFASLLITRYVSGWRGRKAAWFTLGGVILTMLGMFGFHLFNFSKHNLFVQALAAVSL